MEEDWNGNCRDMKAGNGRRISVFEVGLMSKVINRFGLMLEKAMDREGDWNRLAWELCRGWIRKLGKVNRREF